MRLIVKKWGNSHGIMLSKPLLDHLGVHGGDELNIKLENNRLIFEPIENVRGRYRLEDLLEQIPEDHRAEEITWGGPQGDEVF